MDRRKPTLSAWKAWTMFLLALVAVGAPVWANAYVCPMDRAAKAASSSTGHENACCQKVQTLPPPAFGVVALELPCDCAQLQWDVSSIDQTRQSVLAMASPVALLPLVDLQVPSRVSSLGRLRTNLSPPPVSSPPLWILNQSIRC